MSETVSTQPLFISAAVVVAALCMGSAPAKAFFQPTLGIAAKAEVGAVEQVNGRRRYYRSYVYPHASYPSAWGTLPSACVRAVRACVSRIPPLCAVSVLPTVLCALGAAFHLRPISVS